MTTPEQATPWPNQQEVPSGIDPDVPQDPDLFDYEDDEPDSDSHPDGDEPEAEG
jgi:hypothetical protein